MLAIWRWERGITLAKAATIYDVGRSAGVSPATVSRVFSRTDLVDEETARRVRAAAEKLGYVPNIVARNLRKRTSDLVAVLVPDIMNPFYPGLVRGIQDAVEPYGYQVIICNVDDQPDRELRFLEMVRARGINHVICGNAGRAAASDAFLKELASHGVRIVTFGRRVEGARLDMVSVNTEEGAREAVRHLAVLGHRRVGYIGFPRDLGVGKGRFRGYCAECLAQWGQVDESLVYEGRGDEASGRAAVHAWQAVLGGLPTAVFAANDEMAIGAMAALQDEGVRVPDDVSIVGFDDIPLASVVRPRLTTVAQPIMEMGFQAGRLLVAVGQGEHDGSRTELFATQLVLRESTALVTEDRLTFSSVGKRN